MYITNNRSYENLIDIKDILPFQLQIWRYVLSSHVTFSDTFCNPFRVDNNPDCYLSNTNKIIRLVDWADHYSHRNGHHGMSCIDAIRLKYSCGTKRALQIAYYEALNENTYNLPIYKPRPKRTFPFKIKPDYRNWKLTDKSFWNGTTDITSKQLEKEQCFPLKQFWYTDKKGIYKKSVPKTPTYINHIKDASKVYQPENRFWLTNFTNEHIGGFEKFKDNNTLIITKNLKSYLCIVNLGYNCRYTPNEGMYLHAKFLQDISKFKNIYILFDNDEAGIKASLKIANQFLQEIGKEVYPIHFNTDFLKEEYEDCFGNKKKVKDAFDICKKYNIDKLNKELEYELQNI